MHAITVARNRLLGLPQNVAVKQALVTANGTLITSMDAVVTDC
jgi:hypothetical protein